MGLFSFFTRNKPETEVQAPRRAVVRASSSSANRNAPPRQVNSGSQEYYQALNNTPDRTPIPIGRLTFNYIARTWNRERLTLLARYLYDNDGRVSYAVDTIANYSVPIDWQSASGNPEWDRKADEYLAIWEMVSDFTGRFDFCKIQRFLC